MAGALPGPVLLDEAMGTTLRRGPDEARPDHVSHVGSASARARSHVAPPHAPEKISRAGMQGPERTATTSVADLLAPPGVPDVREPGGLAAIQSNGAAMEASQSTIDATEQTVTTIGKSAGACEYMAAATAAGPTHAASAADPAWQASGAAAQIAWPHS